MAKPSPPKPSPVSSRPARERGDQTSTGFRTELAKRAMGLRNEQVNARIVYYGADQATSPELDAVTEAVVQQLVHFQQEMLRGKPVGLDHQELEIATIQALREGLERLFGARRENFLRFRTQEVSRRVTKLFFESALGTRLARDQSRPRQIRFPVQAIYYALAPHLAAIEKTLGEQRYASSDVQDHARDRLRQMVKDLRVEFLRLTTTELEVILRMLGTALASFFQEVLVPGLGDLAWRVVRESRVVEQGDGRPQITEAAFPPFRAAFEKAFLDILVDAMRDRVEDALADGSVKLGADSVEFLASPDVYVEVCSIVCDSVYDFLHSEGFLDLPPNWRAHLHRVRAGAQ